MRQAFWQSNAKVFGIAALLAVLAIAGFFLLQGQAQQSSEIPVVKIGYIGVLSGPASAGWGLEARDAAELAVEEINSKGNVRLELVFGDSAAQAEKGVTEFRRIQDFYNPDIFLVEASAVASAVAPLAEGAGKPVLFSAVATVGITERSPLLFRNFYTCDKDAPLVAGKAFERLGFKKIAILFQNEPFGQSCMQYFSDSFESIGGGIVANEGFLVGDTDFKTQLLKIKDSGAEALYLVGYERPQLETLKQMKELAISLPVLSSRTVYAPVIRSEVVKLANPPSLYFTSSEFYANPSEKAQAFIEKFQQRFGKNPSHVPAYVYDSIFIIASAAEISNSQGISLQQALKKVRFEGMHGSLEFDEKRETLQKAFFVQLNPDGSLKVLD